MMNSDLLTPVSPEMGINDNSENFDELINKVLKKLKDSEFVSVFFLLMDYISPSDYFDIIEKDRNLMEDTFKKILSRHDRDKKDILIEIVGTLKRNDLLKLLGTCCHQFIKHNKEGSLYKLNRLWKILYHICDLIDPTKDSESLKKLFPEKTSIDLNYPEIIFVEAYQQKLFTESDLNNISAIFKNDRPDISEILDEYIENGCNFEYYHIKTPTPSSPCGLAVIINHENFWPENSNDLKLSKRENSPIDVNALKKLWEMYGFKVVVHKDLSDIEVLAVFKNLADLDLSSYDIFVSCYLSHGNEGVVYASNCRPISISCLTDMVANKSDLCDKPKLFFIQACQGTTIQRGISYPTIKLPQINSNTQAIPRVNTPLYSDVLEVVSSIPGYVSFASDGKKSWFIDALVTNMEKFGRDVTIQDIMLKVCEQVSKQTGNIAVLGNNVNDCKQMPICKATLRKRLKFKKISF